MALPDNWLYSISTLVLFITRTYINISSDLFFCRTYSSEVTSLSARNSNQFQTRFNFKSVGYTRQICYTVSNEQNYGRDVDFLFPDNDETNVNHGVWFIRYQQLVKHKSNFGHTRVPKRYEANPSLGNWVNKQRQQYQNYQLGKKPCSLTEQRIQLLNQLGFCWNGVLKQKLTEGVVDSADQNLTCMSNNEISEKDWIQKFDQLCIFVNAITDDLDSADIFLRKVDKIPRHSRLGIWLHQQRLNYRKYGTHANASSYHKYSKKFELLEKAIDSHWHLGRREYQWEYRFHQLQEYKRLHGDCCVPISYKENKQLGQWVSNQRKKYSHIIDSKCSTVADDKAFRLQQIGFAFNRWEYEFGRKFQI